MVSCPLSAWERARAPGGHHIEGAARRQPVWDRKVTSWRSGSVQRLSSNVCNVSSSRTIVVSWNSAVLYRQVSSKLEARSRHVNTRSNVVSETPGGSRLCSSVSNVSTPAVSCCGHSAGCCCHWRYQAATSIYCTGSAGSCTGCAVTYAVYRSTSSRTNTPRDQPSLILWCTVKRT